MLSKRGLHACRSRWRENVARLPTLSARNSSAPMPMATKIPTQRSIVVAVHAGSMPPVNMNAVRTKSSARIASEDVTTVRVVARDTPSAVGFAS